MQGGWREKADWEEIGMWRRKNMIKEKSEWQRLWDNSEKERSVGRTGCWHPF